mgnify:CR=1 FL=1
MPSIYPRVNKINSTNDGFKKNLVKETVKVTNNVERQQPVVSEKEGEEQFFLQESTLKKSNFLSLLHCAYGFGPIIVELEHVRYNFSPILTFFDLKFSSSFSTKNGATLPSINFSALGVEANNNCVFCVFSLKSFTTFNKYSPYIFLVSS